MFLGSDKHVIFRWIYYYLIFFILFFIVYDLLLPPRHGHGHGQGHGHAGLGLSLTLRVMPCIYTYIESTLYVDWIESSGVVNPGLCIGWP